MKILVVSDTHRKDENLKLVLEQVCPVDMLIHLGDAEGSERFIPEWVNPHCFMAMVQGNNDFFSTLKPELEIEIGPHKVFLTHGHYYGVSMGPEGLADEAKSRGCDIAMYGHTHRPHLDVDTKPMLINPGSLSYPRQEGRKPSYVVMEIDASGEVKFSLKYL